MNKMYTLNSQSHEMYIQERNKKSLSPFDDKRYILPDGIRTLPHANQINLVLFEMIENISFH